MHLPSIFALIGLLIAFSLVLASLYPPRQAEKTTSGKLWQKVQRYRGQNPGDNGSQRHSSIFIKTRGALFLCTISGTFSTAVLRENV